MINHKELLSKYIQYIVEMEGTDYLGYDYIPSNFTKVEWDELRRQAIMETSELKTVWSDDPERYHSLHRVDEKTVRVRGVFGRHMVAEIFSSALLRWEVVAFTTERILEHTAEHVNEATVALLDEVKLILGDDM